MLTFEVEFNQEITSIVFNTIESLDLQIDQAAPHIFVFNRNDVSELDQMHLKEVLATRHGINITIEDY